MGLVHRFNFILLIIQWVLIYLSNNPHIAQHHGANIENMPKLMKSTCSKWRLIITKAGEPT